MLQAVGLVLEQALVLAQVSRATQKNPLMEGLFMLPLVLRRGELARTGLYTIFSGDLLGTIVIPLACGVH